MVCIIYIDFQLLYKRFCDFGMNLSYITLFITQLKTYTNYISKTYKKLYLLFIKLFDSLLKTLHILIDCL
jgi:hypothetical protein